MEILVIFIAFLPLVFSNSFEESLFMDEWKVSRLIQHIALTKG